MGRGKDNKSRGGWGNDGRGKLVGWVVGIPAAMLPRRFFANRQRSETENSIYHEHSNTCHSECVSM